MGTSTSPVVADHPAPNSPSSFSYSSSGVSRSSSIRLTSLDPIATVSSSSQRSSPLLDLNLGIDIEHTPNAALDRHHKMDRNPFHSVNERRNKLATDRNSIHQLQQVFQASLPPAGMSSRGGVSSANWRSPDEGVRANANANANAGAGANGNGNEMMAPIDASPTGSHQQHARHSSGIRQPAYLVPTADHYQQQASPYPNHNANMGAFSDMQLDASYAYCYDRGNGQYTRLVPVDMLPSLQEIAPLQQGCAGMIVVPQPRALPPDGCSSNVEAVILRGPADAPSSPSDNIQFPAFQSRIDTIVASTPATPSYPTSPSSVAGHGLGPASAVTTVVAAPHHSGHGHPHPHSVSQVHHHHGGPVGGGNGGVGGGYNHNHNHGNINVNGGGSGGNNGSNQPQRRPKIYCDKWVHEGVCAFTQQGCKYKHEMPFDKVTQHQLGLFHGFPAWWKKHQADLSRQREGDGDDAAAEPAARLSTDRYIGRGNGGSGHAAQKGHSASPVGTAVTVAATAGGPGEPAAADMGQPTPPQRGPPTWRRQGPGESHRAAMAAGRGMPARLTGGMRPPAVSYSMSPFGPIAPPTRTPIMAPRIVHAGNAADAGQTGEAGKAVKSANPYESLPMENLSLKEKGNDIANTNGNAVDSRTTVAATNDSHEPTGSNRSNRSNGARLV
ncbi:hypothetical protein GGR52DRAFT_575678 [Hypoxylon sp. FL1284]|nr:hypothetical protein GGR52DRAFT_575678 [Hypoxylon sp. FL1284]